MEVVEDSAEIDYIRIANEFIANGTTIETMRADIPGTNIQVDLKEYNGTFAFKSGMQIDDDGVGIDYNSLIGISASNNPHQTTTSYMSGILNADIHPYYVLPYPNNSDIWLGDLGAIIDTTTGRVVYAIHGDNQIERKLGEASVKVHNELFNANINTLNPQNSQKGHGTMDIVYIMFPNSRQTNLDYTAIQVAGEALFREYFL